MCFDDKPGCICTLEHTCEDTAASVHGSAPSHGSRGMADGVRGLFDLLRFERFSLARINDDGPEARHLIPQILAKLDTINGHQLCVTPQDCIRVTNSSGVGFQCIYGGGDFMVCIFLLRTGAVIPLHDHPDMHVFARLLFGRLRVVSYDPEPPVADRSSVLRSATCRSVELLGPEPVTFGLGPNEGNLHELVAIEDCAFVEIVTPPYDELANRDCTYYRLAHGAVGNSTCSPGRRYLLEPFRPIGFCTEQQEYTGPRLTL